MVVPQALEVVVKEKLLNMRFYWLLALNLFFHAAYAQESLKDVLEKYNSNDVPYVSIAELNTTSKTYILLDAREIEEFKVSHLKDAIHVGYNNFTMESVNDQVPNKNSDIVVYCSLGVRSEVIASKLIEAGYTNVQNLYGGIFEWKNQNHDVYNLRNQVTDSVHAYSKTWSKWLNSGIKVFSKD